ncbi:MAG: hypothetical protein GOU98_00335 [Candidatus Altiarchaeota archaeon]|nr:hypothetical protein [Candidatus Altiarchaeota archaeon]
MVNTHTNPAEIEDDLRFERFYRTIHDGLQEIDNQFQEEPEKTEAISREFSKYLIKNGALEITNRDIEKIYYNGIMFRHYLGYELEHHDTLLDIAINFVEKGWETQTVPHPLADPFWITCKYLSQLENIQAVKELVDFFKPIYSKELIEANYLVSNAIDRIKELNSGKKPIHRELMDCISEHPYYVNPQTTDVKRSVVVTYILDNIENTYYIHQQSKAEETNYNLQEAASNLGISLSDNNLVANEDEKRFCPFTKKELKKGQKFHEDVKEYLK